MKRKISVAALMMLVASLLMFGCGSSGGGGSAGTTTSAGGSSGDNGNIVIGKASDNPGYITINFDLGTTTSKTSAIMKSASSSLPRAQWARVVIMHVTTVSDTEGDYTVTDYKQIQDYDLSVTTAATLAVAPGTDYQVNVISYLKNLDHNTLLKYGSETVNIVSGQTTQATITATPFDAGLTPPSQIASGSSYFVSWNAGTSPLRNEKNLLVSNTPISGLFVYGAANSSFLRTAPVLSVNDSSTNLFYQGLFFLSDDLLNSATENWQNWRYYEPNPDEFGDPQLSSSIMPPGAITINVTL